VRLHSSILTDPLTPCQCAPDQTCRTMSFLGRSRPDHTLLNKRLMNLDSIKEGAWTVLVWVGIIGCVFLLVRGCQWVSQRKAEINQLKADKEFSEFCSINNATPAFKGLPSADLLTIDLQDSLFVNEKRVAFKSKISDVWKSKKHGSMMAAFRVNHGGRDIDAYLKCTESQAQNLHDEYRRDKNTTFLSRLRIRASRRSPTIFCRWSCAHRLFPNALTRARGLGLNA
jgi:hypothetical protein